MRLYDWAMLLPIVMKKILLVIALGKTALMSKKIVKFINRFLSSGNGKMLNSSGKISHN
ncbi:MAG: hypothetical protein LUH47_00510 [Clostridiales bacterium]|nr:hypothetical protein [Clostridiales bacterium]